MEFGYLLDHVRLSGLGWIQDIVPNHMAYSPENFMLMDVLELGARSRYRDVFDIDWRHHSAALNGKVLAPFLEWDLEDSIRKGAITLEYYKGFKLGFSQQFPVNMESYPRLLASRPDLLERIQKEVALTQLLQGLEAGNVEQFQVLKEACSRLHSSSLSFRGMIEGILNRYNSNKELLKSLVLSQNFLVANWRSAFKEINYRRFFDINELICVRVEDEGVFGETHRLVLGLLRDRRIDGVRADHIDGLQDPAHYLRLLRRSSPSTYAFIEKILMPGEELPSRWEADGTTGYDFLNALNGIFVEPANEGRFNEIYSGFTGVTKDFEEVLWECKRGVLRKLFIGEMDNLLHSLRGALPNSEGMLDSNLREAIEALVSSLPVYRTYLSRELREEDKKSVACTIEGAKGRSPRLSKELDAIRGLLESVREPGKALEWFLRLQQFTGPVMAKSLEDTSFYIYNRLLSLNEVGNRPGFGTSVEEFHRFNSRRMKRWPSAMSATSTHDTKRAEDARARLNVLSEIPEEWEERLEKWHMMNLPKKEILGDREVPSRNEEYYIYQSLIASFPFTMEELGGFRERFRVSVVKAAREAKVNTSWLEPAPDYEASLASFVDSILELGGENEFLKDFTRFQRYIAYFGVFNSLSQTLLKITCPGIPDFYQGSELWDLSMVDPDNRRPVDFQKRVLALGKVANARESELAGLLESHEDGLVKLFVTNRALMTRRKWWRLFSEGEYLPIGAEGRLSSHVVAFARSYNGRWAVAAAPRFLTRVVKYGEMPLGQEVWGGTRLALPEDAPLIWKEAFSRRNVRASEEGGRMVIDLGDLFKSFPVALLEGTDRA